VENEIFCYLSTKEYSSYLWSICPAILRLNPSAMRSRLIEYLATSFPGTQAVISSREDLL